MQCLSLGRMHPLRVPQASRNPDRLSSVDVCRTRPGRTWRSALSDQQIKARALSATPLLSPTRVILSPEVVATLSISLIVTAAVLDAALRGPWLDEFWTLELSNRSNGLIALIRDGWLRDAHPPLFNAWATLLSFLAADSIPVGRIVCNLPAAALMVLAALRLPRRGRGETGFGIVLLLLVLSLPDAMDSFATYRSYFWQIASVASLVLIGRHIVRSDADLDEWRDLDIAAIAVVASAASISLHYVGGLFGGLLSVAFALAAFMRGHVRWAVLLGTTSIVSAGFIAASVALQAPNWALEFDHSWIDMPILEAFFVPLSLGTAAILHNPVSLLGLRLDFDRPQGRSEQLFVGLIAGVLATGTVIVLTVHAFKPIVVDRYLVAVPVLVSALMAVPAARLVPRRLLFGLLAVVSLAAVIAPIADSGIKPLWNEGAHTIRQIVAACPTTRVYAASGWALGPAAETRAAHREDPVFELAYRSLAARYGFEVEFLPLDSATRATLGPCPVLLWYEHTPNDAEKVPAAAVEEAHLFGLEHARLSAIRSLTGFVVRAD